MVAYRCLSCRTNWSDREADKLPPPRRIECRGCGRSQVMVSVVPGPPVGRAEPPTHPRAAFPAPREPVYRCVTPL